MENKAAPLVSFVFTLTILSFLIKVPVHVTPSEGNKSTLYGGSGFDDPHGASEYNFSRLRNPVTGYIPKDIRKQELAFAANLPKRNESSRSLTWQNRGPYNLGGRTRALALDVTNENIILAGQVSGGMWRSTDAGASFVKTTQPGQLHSTTCVVQDTRPGKTNVWYYGTGENYGIVNAAGFSSQFSGDGILKSSDGGISWTQLPSTVSNSPTTLHEQRDFDFVWEMVTDATNTTEDEVYAAVVNGIWRSIDGGTSWIPVLGLDTSITQISEYTDIAITSNGVLYASVSSETASKGIWRSEDGVNWVNITPAGFAAAYRRIEIGISPGDETQVYFIAETPGTGTTGHSLWKYKYLSGDGTGAGGKWVNRTTNIPDDNCTGYFNFDFRKFNSQSSYDLFVVVHPADTNLVFLGGTDIYRSTDGFSTAAYDWIGGYQCDTNRISNYVYPNHHPDQHKLLFLPSNTNTAISGTDGGLMKTTDITSPAIQWQLMGKGYNTGQFYTCAIEPGNTNNEIIIGGLQDNGTYFTNTPDYTRDWSKTFYGDGSYCAITHGRSDYYLSIQQGKIYKHKVDDTGAVNNLYTRIDPLGGSNYLFINPFILDPFDDDVMYMAGGRSLWRNDSLSFIPMTGDEYNTVSLGWKRLTGTSLGSGFTAPRYSSLDMSEANTNILYAGTDNGKLYRMDSCLTNNAVAKTDITGVNFPAGAYLSCVEVDRLNMNKVLVTFSNYGVKSIFYSDNAGVSWTDVSGSLEEQADGSGNGPSVNWAHIYNDGSVTNYYVGTSTGLYSTANLNGANTVWEQEGANSIGNVVINMITSRTFDNKMVVATHGNGIYTNKIFTPSSISYTKHTAMEVNCYPNPFSSSVVIESGMDSKGTMDAEIFDLSGRAIRKMHVTNSSSVIWNGNDAANNVCAAGTYFVRITLNGKSKVMKIVKI
ncbi:MAG: T9SS type A sorting domain-containing protein [Bacteroidota bacterium]